MNRQIDSAAGASGISGRGRWKLMGLAALGGLGGVPLIRHPDERIAATTQRLAARAGALLGVLLGVDIIVRALILRQDPRLYWDIGLIWLVSVFMLSFGLAKSGVPTANIPGRQGWLMVAGIALEVPLLMWLINGRTSVGEFAMSALLAGGSAAVALVILRALYSRWERRTLDDPSGG